jgi:predicted GNAT family acetyltransferase
VEADFSIIHRSAPSGSSGTFDLERGGRKLGHLDYSLPDDRTMSIDYVEVAPALRGKQMGVRLVEAAVTWARSGNRMVVAACSYARAELGRTAAFQDFVMK